MNQQSSHNDLKPFNLNTIQKSQNILFDSTEKQMSSHSSRATKKYEDNNDPDDDEDDDDNDDDETFLGDENDQKNLFILDDSEEDPGDDFIHGDVIQVNCNSIVGDLYKNKFGSGGKGSCIRVLVKDPESEEGASNTVEKWLTPIEFENFCGKSNCRDWKRTIKVGGQPLLTLIASKVLICHAISCSCAVCVENDQLVGPVRLHMSYRRRKKDEILAQNAYKKFLSLKPPTLFRDALLSKISESNPLSSSSILENQIDRSCKKSLLNNSQESFLSSNTNFNLSFQNSNSSSNDTDDVNAGLRNETDINTFFEKMEQIEEKRWNNLEQTATNLVTQAQNLQAQIERAKKESQERREILMEKILSSLKNSNTPKRIREENSPMMIVIPKSAYPFI